MNKKPLFSPALAITVCGVCVFSPLARAQNVNYFSAVSALSGVQISSSDGTQDTVTVGANAYYLLNGSKHSIRSVIGVYELFSQPTASPLPGATVADDALTSGPSVGGVSLGHATGNKPGSSGPGLYTTALSAWTLKTSQDAMAFGYEAPNKTLAIGASQSRGGFVFTKGSPLIGFHVVEADGKSVFIERQPAVIPEGSSLLGFSCLTLLGGLSILRKRAFPSCS